MNYQYIYDCLIKKSKLENRQKNTGIYYEQHHIVPRCLGGTEDKENLILLTAREHFIAHKLLCEIYPNNKGLRLAVWIFVNKMQSYTLHRNYRISSREYEQAKHDMINCLSNRIVSKETRDKQSRARKGKRFTSEHKKQISLAKKGKKKSLVYYKFTYNDYLQMYNEFIEINKKNPYIGIELYCNNTNQISNTTFRKFIKDNNLICPRAKKCIKTI
jgi:hypothetical protein